MPAHVTADFNQMHFIVPSFLVYAYLLKNSERKKGSTYTTLKQSLKPNNTLHILLFLKIVLSSVFAVSIVLYF